MNKFLYKIQELEDEQHLSLTIDTACSYTANDYISGYNFTLLMGKGRN